jgi:uncharacterized protein with von Willebrand factor type A (vWA) domain
MLSETVASCTPAAPPDDLADRLVSRYAGFAAWLRAHGFLVGSGEVAASLDVAQRMGQFDGELLRWSLRALLCSRAEDWRRFDALFDAYFQVPNRRVQVAARHGGAGPLAAPPGDGPRDASEGMPLARAGSDDTAGNADGGAAERGACAAESLARTDFAHLNQPDELYAIDAALRRFAERLQRITTRRERQAANGAAIDLPRTIRRSVSQGGVPLELAWRRRRRVRPRIVLLLDVSRSMNLYSFFYLRLARVLSARVSDVHAFIFHTRLVGVGEALGDPDPWRSQERLHLLSAGWSGGTRIGDSLAEFNRRHAAKLLHSRTAVVIASDGYDAGDPARLSDALAALRRRCRSVVWLNPLAGRADFAPVSAGMSAALPHLDLLAGAGDLASLERVLPQVLSILR